MPLAWALPAMALWPLRLLLAGCFRLLARRRPDARLLVLADLLALPAFVLGLRGLLAAALPVDAELAEELRIAAGIALCLVLAWLTTRALDVFLWRRLERSGETPLPQIAIHLVAGVIYILALMVIVAEVLDRPLTGLLVSSSVVAGVIGLALQGTLTDLLAGIAISIDRPYRIGDWLEVEGGFIGEVIDITWRSTRLLSWNDSVYVIPNSRAAKAVLHNLDLPSRRYGLWFGIWLPAEVSPATARQAISEACLSSPELLPEPMPTVRLRNIGHDPVEYRIFAYFRSYPEHFQALDDVLDRIWTQLRHLGIQPAATAQELRVRRGVPASPQPPTDSELLRRVPIFRCLSAEDRTALAHGAAQHRLAAGEIIVREGEPGSSLFVMATGVARVTHAVPGRPPLELARLSVCDHFGEMSLLTGEPRSASVEALTDCRLLSIDKADLEAILRERPRIVAELAAIVARRRDRTARALGAARGDQEATLDHTRLLMARIRSFFGLGEG